MSRHSDPLPTPSTVEEMAEAIVDLIGPRDYVSLVELMWIPGAPGDHEMLFADTNIVLWQGVSTMFADAMNDLRQTNRIFSSPCHFLVYLADGGMLRMPLVTRKPPQEDSASRTGCR
jgi:hypothetical protein